MRSNNALGNRFLCLIASKLIDKEGGARDKYTLYGANINSWSLITTMPRRQECGYDDEVLRCITGGYVGGGGGMAGRHAAQCMHEL